MSQSSPRVPPGRVDWLKRELTSTPSLCHSHLVQVIALGHPDLCDFLILLWQAVIVCPQLILDVFLAGDTRHGGYLVSGGLFNHFSSS